MNQKRTWETKNGTELDICKMETTHIENCINMLDRKIKNGFLYQIGGGSCPDDFWYDEEWLKGKEAKKHFQPEYNWLKAELRKRKLLIIKK